VCVCVCVCARARARVRASARACVRATARSFWPDDAKTNTDNFLSSVSLTLHSQVFKTEKNIYIHKGKNHALLTSLLLTFWPGNILSQFWNAY
jgi:hypothetical protein